MRAYSPEIARVFPTRWLWFRYSFFNRVFRIGESVTNWCLQQRNRSLYAAKARLNTVYGPLK